MFRSEYHPGGRSGIQSSAAEPARKSLERLGRSQGGSPSALSMVTGPPYPLRRSISAAASPAAPPPMIRTEEGGAAFEIAAGPAGGSFPRTNRFSPACSTRQHGIGSSAGALRASPVRKLKQA